MQTVGWTANSLLFALITNDTLALVVVAAVAAAIIYLIATYAITRARDRDDRRCSDDKSR